MLYANLPTFVEILMISRHISTIHCVIHEISLLNNIKIARLLASNGNYTKTLSVSLDPTPDITGGAYDAPLDLIVS